LGKKILGFILALIFIGGFGVGGVLMLGATVRQARTSSWPAAAEASITSSRVVRSGDGYAPAIAYRYRAADGWHDGTAIRLGGGFSSSDGRYANTMVAQFAQGQPVVVYVNPADSAESVLVRGMDDHQYQMISFAFPFLAISATLLVCTVTWYARRGRGYVGRIRVFEPAPGVTVARDSAATPLACAFMAAAGVAFVGVFVVFLALNAYAIAGVVGHLSLALAAGAAAFIWRSRWLAAGRDDTVIDANAGLLLIARGKKERVDAVPLTDVEAVKFEERTSGGSEKSTEWWLTLRTKSGDKPRDMMRLYSGPDGELLERWFSERLDEARRGRR
jgi:hypothetical protein